MIGGEVNRSSGRGQVVSQAWGPLHGGGKDGLDGLWKSTASGLALTCNALLMARLSSQNGTDRIYDWMLRIHTAAFQWWKQMHTAWYGSAISSLPSSSTKRPSVQSYDELLDTWFQILRNTASICTQHRPYGAHLIHIHRRHCALKANRHRNNDKKN